MTDRADLHRRIREACLLRGSFVLRSGQISSTYFDKYRFEAQPDLLRAVVAEMVKLLPPATEVLAGLELGGIPLATAMTLQTGLPMVFVRKEAKTYGTMRAVEGPDISGRKLTIVEDVITTGGAVVDAERLLRDEGADILAVVCAIWRGEGAAGIGALPQVPVRAAFEAREILAA